MPWLQTHCIVSNSFCTVNGTIHYHCSLHDARMNECVVLEVSVLQSCENESGWYNVAAAATRKSARFSPIACGFRWLITSINILVRTSFFFLTLIRSVSLCSLLFAHIESSRRDANQLFNILRAKIGSKFKWSTKKQQQCLMNWI